MRGEPKIPKREQAERTLGILAVVLLSFFADEASGQATKRANATDPAVLRLEQTVKSLQESLRGVNRRLSNLSALDNRAIVLDPAVLGKYGRIDGDPGTFLISLDNVEPYLDGHKVRLLVGNPSSGTYSGFSFTVRWGKREPRVDSEESAAAWQRWHDSLTSKGFSGPDQLRAGAWNRVEIIITGSQAGFGYLEISSLQTPTIYLQAAPPLDVK
jgi:hypothetical protein